MGKHYVGQEYQAATNGKGLQQNSRGVRIITRLTVTFSVLVMLISLGMIGCCLAFFISPIRGTSMMTTLNASGEDTDSSVTCRIATPKRGDIVIAKLYCQYTHDYIVDANGKPVTTKYLQERYDQSDKNGRFMYVIKRLIAVGGDRITMRRVPNGGNHADTYANYDYAIYLNGEKLVEDYLDPKVAPLNGKNFIQLWKVLNNSDRADLSSWKATKWEDCVTTINGVATLTIPDGYYFLMGDNRNGYDVMDPDTNEVSHTSASWDCAYFGPLPKSDFVGLCVDVIPTGSNMAGYIWDKIVYYVFFGWVWQR